MKLVIRKDFSWGFAIILLLLMFQDAISVAVPMFSYFDEIESIFLVCVLFWCIFVQKKKLLLDVYQKRYIVSFLLLLIVGLIGNVISSYKGMGYIFLDILVYSKFTINLICVSLIVNNNKINKYEETAWKVACIVSVVLITLIIHESFFTPLWPYLEDRYGMKSLKLFFSTQTYLALIGAMLLFIHYNLGEHRRGTNLFCFLDLLITASTFRAKALGFVAIAALIIFVVGKKKKITKLNIICTGCILIIVAISVGYDYLFYYYLSGNETSIRLMILNGGIELANRHIPFGMGFATYCSLGAKLNNSLTYKLIGMQDIYEYEAIYDNFWASVIGQFGYLGFVIYMILVYRLIVMIIQTREISTRRFWTGILVCSYLLIASLGESSFNAFYACFMGLYLGYLYHDSVSVRKKIK